MAHQISINICSRKNYFTCSALKSGKTNIERKAGISSIIHVLFIVIIIGTHSFYNKGDGYI
jgi:hypothetical protein